MSDLDIIIESLGFENEYIEDEELLMNIFDEIDSINEDDYFELAIISIQLGKPQILEYILEHYKTTKEETAILYKEIEKYKIKQESKSEDTDDEDDLKEILIDFKGIIKNCTNFKGRSI